jgi:signal transduction histidine kinase
MPNDAAAPRSAARANAHGTGLDSLCLRQALHDLRGPLNNATILLEVIKNLGAQDPALGRAKMTQTVQELHRMARMLEQLAVASDSVAADLGPVPLHALLLATTAAIPASARIEVRDGDGTPLQTNSMVLSSLPRLERALHIVFERCVAALPEGGHVRLDSEVRADSLRLTLTAKGPRVVPPAGQRPHLTDGSNAGEDWFLCWALVRGVRGELHVDHGNDVGIRIAIELPRPAAV